MWCLSKKGELENDKLYFRGENLKRPKKDVEERMDEGEEDEEIDEEDIEEDEEAESHFFVDLEPMIARRF